MKRRAWIFSSLVLPLLAGCASDPAEHEYQPPERKAKKQVRKVESPPNGLLAPVDEWKRELGHALPLPWKLASISPQIEAPPGWARVDGNRGLELTFARGETQQRFWVMPADFSARTVEDQGKAIRWTQNERFILYTPQRNAQGWKADHTNQVVHALGLN